MRQSDLKPCEMDKRVCVTDVRDCGPRRPSSTPSENTRAQQSNILILGCSHCFCLYLVFHSFLR